MAAAWRRLDDTTEERPPVLTAQNWPLWQTALLLLVCWAVLALPWLSGVLTVPWDAKAHFHPQLQALASAIHSGQSPFWTPHVFAGHPQIADPQSLVFSPLHLALAALTPQPTLAMGDAVLFVLLLLGGFGLLVFFRDRAWHPAGAIVAALSFAFGMAAAWRIQHVGQVMSLAYLAMALPLLSRLLATGRLRYALAFGVVAGLMVLGRDQVALIGVYLLIAFVLAFWVSATPRWQAMWRSLPPLIVAAIVIAIVAGGPSLLTALMAEESNRPAILLSEAGKGSLHPASLMTALIGNLYGAAGPLEHHWGPPSPSWGPVDLYLARNMAVVYAGALPFMALILTGLLQGRLWRPDIRFFACALLVALLYALGRYTPAFTMLFQLPGVSLYRRPADMVFILGLLGAICGGYCVHLLASRQAGRLLRWQGLALVLVIAAGFGGGLWLAHEKGTLGIAWPSLLVAVASVMLGAGVLIGLPLLRRRPPLTAALLAGLAMTIDLSATNGPSESTAMPASMYEVLEASSQNPTIAFVKQQLAQTAGPDRRDRIEIAGVDFHWPNASLVHGLDNVLGYNPLRLGLYSQATGAEDHVALPSQRKFSPLMPGYRSLLADMLGLRLIVTGVPAEEIDKTLKPGDLTLLKRTDQAYIYENKGALPRALFVPAAQPADFTAILASGEWPAGFDPRQSVLVDTARPSGRVRITPPPNARGPAPAAGAGQVSIAAYRNSVVEIDVTAPVAGYLVLNDVWHRWWQAEVNGSAAEVLRANVLFRAVAVPEGRSKVVFRFQPVRGALADLEARWRTSRSAAP